MNIEDRITQLEAVIERLNVEIPIEVLPVGMWGKVSGRHYVRRVEENGYGGPEIGERHATMSDGGEWKLGYVSMGDLKCTPVRWEDVPDRARWAR